MLGERWIRLGGLRLLGGGLFFSWFFENFWIFKNCGDWREVSS